MRAIYPTVALKGFAGARELNEGTCLYLEGGPDPSEDSAQLGEELSGEHKGRKP